MARQTEEHAQVEAPPEEVEVAAATVLVLLRKLPARERLWVIAQALPEAERELPPQGPLRSALGILAHLGPAPSGQEIDEARHELWSGGHVDGRE